MEIPQDLNGFVFSFFFPLSQRKDKSQQKKKKNGIENVGVVVLLLMHFSMEMEYRRNNIVQD